MAIFRKWTLHHLVVFLLTFLSYACFHATRKAFSNVKNVMQKEWTKNPVSLDPPQTWESKHFFKDEHHAELFLGAMDTTFLLAYAVGLYISGILGDRFNLTRVLAFGMCSSAVMVFMFGTVSKWIGVYNIWYYGVFMALNGLLQSTGWPCVVAVMGNWFGKSSRGIVFGIWSANASVGNIFGALQVAAILDYGYEYAMLVPAAVLFAFGILIFFCLTPSPDLLGLPMPEEENQPSDSASREVVFSDASVIEQESFAHKIPSGLSPSAIVSASYQSVKPQHRKAVTFCQAVLLPGVIPYSLSYACLKLVNYSFFFWLPFYLSNKFGWKDTVADKISTFYDVGGIVGGIVGGLISDLMGKRTPLVVVMLMISVPMLFIYGNVGGHYTLNAALMCTTGIFIGGPANLISSAISADLGRQSALSASSEALATVTGIVDGTGSVGAAIGQFIVSEINTHSGWKPVFYFLMVMAFMSFVCLLIPPLIKFSSNWLFGESDSPHHYYHVVTSDQLDHPPEQHVNDTLANS
ncbi:sugar phosphate exchanger 3-like isoform X2 [Montipora capricornis]|uniref:sugar phosphate exchanger 3-like isoform X2 n=1 Tax=Montipora capricornis TaxID=246305 RepID=UPI0035F16F90